MRGAPQSGFSMLIRRINTRSSVSICGRPQHNPLATFKTQHEAIEWAKKNNHSPHVARSSSIGRHGLPTCQRRSSSSGCTHA
jgi:hypothetical protein